MDKQLMIMVSVLMGLCWAGLEGGGGGVVPHFLKKVFPGQSAKVLSKVFRRCEPLSFVTILAKIMFCMVTRVRQNTASILPPPPPPLVARGQSSSIK